MKILAFLFLSALAFGQLPPTPNLGLTNPSPHAQYAADWYTNFAKIDAGVLLKTPNADQTITGQHVLWNQGRTWLGINGNANHTFGLSPDSYLFNIEQDSTSGTTYPNPSVIMGVAGGLTPIADNSNLFGNSTVVRDFASGFNVGSLGALGGSSFWFGTAGKTLAFGYGVIGASYSDGAGDVGENWGVRGLANPGSAPFTFSGTVNHNKGGTFGSGGFSGTINSDYSVFIELPATGATFTNPHEGLHIEDQTAGGLLANAYGVHILGSALNDLGTGVTKVGLLQAPLSTPASSSATCAAGQMWADTGFVYVCTATNTIKRATLSSF